MSYRYFSVNVCESPVKLRGVKVNCDVKTTSDDKRVHASNLMSLTAADVSKMDRLKLEMTTLRLTQKLKTQSSTNNKLRKNLSYSKSKHDKIEKSKAQPLDDNSNLIDLIKHGKFGKSYHPKVKDFAIGMTRYGTASYKFLRSSLGMDESGNSNLPAIRTIRLWQSVHDGSPGLTINTIRKISKFVLENSIVGPIFFCLKFDEMAIRKGIRYVPYLNKNLGFVDYGEKYSEEKLLKFMENHFNQNENAAEVDNDEEEESRLASKALFYILRCINYDLSLPIGYLLIDSLSGKQKAQLLTQTVSVCDQNSLSVIAVTCDGDKAHFTMMTELGATPKLMKNSDEKIDTIMHFPGIERPIYGHQDPSHMDKSFRNTEAGKEVLFCDKAITSCFTDVQLEELFGKLYDEKIFIEEKELTKRMIMWKFIPLLYELQEKSTMHLGNRISKKVVEWKQNKMKVKYAAIALSNKTANTIFYLDIIDNVKEFKGSLHSVMYMKACDTTFNILDSKNDWARGFKRAISPENVTEVFDMMDSLSRYFESLMLQNGTYLIHSLNHTAYSSALMGFFNAKQLYYTLVTGGIMSSLKMHVLSQDEVEHFIGDQRCRNLGNNNNPDALDLSSSYKNLQSLNEIYFTREGGNCEIHYGEKSMKMLPSSSHSSKQLMVKNMPFQVEDNMKRKIISKKKTQTRSQKSKVTFDAESIRTVTENATVYTAGYIQRKIVENLECELCKISIEEDEYRLISKFIETREFIKFGKLVYPHTHIVEICRKAQHYFQLEARKLKPELPDIVAVRVLRDLMDSGIFIDLIDHPRGINKIEDHRYQLIKKVCHLFIRAKSRHFCNRYNDNLHEKFVRHKLSSEIKFVGQ